MLSLSSFFFFFQNLPLSFAKIHLIDQQPGHLTLWVKRSFWSVKVNYLGRITRLQAGWSEFVRVNNLKMGDACVFVLTNAIKFHYEVEIFRKADAVCTSSQVGL